MTTFPLRLPAKNQLHLLTLLQLVDASFAVYVGAAYGSVSARLKAFAAKFRKQQMFGTEIPFREN
jgi:hypothetical protein